MALHLWYGKVADLQSSVLQWQYLVHSIDSWWIWFLIRQLRSTSPSGKYQAIVRKVPGNKGQEDKQFLEVRKFWSSDWGFFKLNKWNQLYAVGFPHFPAQGLVLNPWTPKIWLSILPSTCCTFPWKKSCENLVLDQNNNFYQIT